MMEEQMRVFGSLVLLLKVSGTWGLNVDSNSCPLPPPVSVSAGQYYKIGSFGVPSIVACPSGYYCPGGFSCPVLCGSSCPGGQYISAGCTSSANIQCASCSPGNYCNGVSSSQCPPGTYQANGGQTYCNGCGVNTYSNSYGWTSCAPCPGGYFSPISSSSCSTCGGGQYWNGNGCSTCPANTYSGGGVSSCPGCPSGQYSTAGASSCTACGPGRYWNGNGCSQCPIGQFSATGASTSCSPCTSGYYCPGLGMSSPTPCGSIGYSGAGQSACTACPTNSTVKNAATTTPLTGCTCPSTSSFWTGTAAAPVCTFCANYGGVTGENVNLAGTMQTQVSLYVCYFLLVLLCI
jgi:hypothetical protein